MLLDAFTLGLGYNATLVTLGSALLGGAAGVCGTFLFLRKRALVSDAISHATLPGVALAFLVMVALGGDGRNLLGLMAGSAMSAVLGLWLVQKLTRHTRLAEDAAIGAILSVFFGFGIVLLTVIQTMEAGKQAGLESFLLGATAGMLKSEALTIAIGGAMSLLAVLLLRRPMTMVAFDPEYASATGMNVSRIDMLTMMLVMAVTVVGLKIVGLILIVALLIIPPVAARFWSDNSDTVALLSGAIGAVAGYTGAALSASAPSMPTGALIVLSAALLFTLSLIVSPRRGLLAAALRQLKYRDQVHMRQGLLAIALQQPIYERLTLNMLGKQGLLRADGVPTDLGRARAAKALLDEERWRALRTLPQFEAAAARYDGLTDLEQILTPDQLTEIDAHLNRPHGVPA